MLVCYSITIKSWLEKFNRTLGFTTTVGVVFVLGTVALGAFQGSRNEAEAFVRVWGGPSSGNGNPRALPEAALTSRSSPDEAYLFRSETGDAIDLAVLVEDAALANPPHPLRGLFSAREGVLAYTVEKGDTLSKIAKNFGVSLETILWANAGLRASRIQPGQKIAIPPLSGVLHQVGPGETVEGIAALYGIPGSAILAANRGILPAAFREGDALMVPNARPKRTRGLASAADALPDLRSYFQMPVKGFSWGELHPRNAVDIANACGTPVSAAAEGLVVRAGNPHAWNDGYGGIVRVEHPNGTATVYAHLGEVKAEEGAYVKQKERIGSVGNTGNTHGVTGCHLHFEVDGAKNPFAK